MFSYDGKQSKKLDFVTENAHAQAGPYLGNYHKQPFIVGGCRGEDNGGHTSVTEILNLQTGKWSKEKSYPYKKE